MEVHSINPTRPEIGSGLVFCTLARLFQSEFLLIGSNALVTMDLLSLLFQTQLLLVIGL